MTERQKGLVKDYGPMFIARLRIIQTEMMKLVPDALSVFTDEEWAECAEAMSKFRDELNKLQSIAMDRVEETLNEGEDFIELYGAARESVKRWI